MNFGNGAHDKFHQGILHAIFFGGRRPTLTFAVRARNGTLWVASRDCPSSPDPQLRQGCLQSESSEYLLSL